MAKSNDTSDGLGFLAILALWLLLAPLKRDKPAHDEGDRLIGAAKRLGADQTVIDTLMACDRPLDKAQSLVAEAEVGDLHISEASRSALKGAVAYVS